MFCRRHEDFLCQYNQYIAFLWQYRKNGIQYQDHSFHPFQNIPESKVDLNPSRVEWKRIDEVYKSPLFDENLIGAEFIQQGNIGNCYCIVASQRIANEPKLVKQLFDKQVDTILGPERDSINIKCGAVAIFFHGFGCETPVVVDTFIPFYKGTNKPVFSRPTNENASPWFCLFEKAYAKYNGSYTNIIGGHSNIVIYSLFGYYPETLRISDLIKNSKENKKTIFKQIVEYLKKGCIMSTSIHNEYTVLSDEEIKKVDLVLKHSYLIEEVFNYKENLFYHIRNPWGCQVFNGNWSSDSPLWTNEIKKALKYEENQNDGSFWMIEEDFVKYFTNINVSCPIPRFWYTKTFSIEINPGQSDGVSIYDANAKLFEKTNFVFKITDDVQEGENVTIKFIIEKKSYVNEIVDNDDIQTKFLAVFAYSNGRKLTNGILKSTFHYQKKCKKNIETINFEIKNINEPLTITIQRITKSEIQEECFFLIACKYKFDLYDIDHPEDIYEFNKSKDLVFRNSAFINQIISKRKKRRDYIPKIKHIENSKDDFDEKPHLRPKTVKDEKPISFYENEISRLNDEIGNLNEVRRIIEEEVNDLSSLELSLKEEIDSIVHYIQNDVDDFQLPSFIEYVEEKRNSLEKVENELNVILVKSNDIDEELFKKKNLIESYMEQINKKKQQNVDKIQRCPVIRTNKTRPRSALLVKPIAKKAHRI